MKKTSIDSRTLRKITRVGGTSYAVTIPIDFIKELQWKSKQKVFVTKEGERIIIEDWKE